MLMSTNRNAYSLTLGGPTGARSLSALAAAIATVCVMSSALVMQEMVVSPPAQAKTAAPTSDFQARWWPGEMRQVNLRTSIMPQNDLTFANGYAQRVAARQAAQQTASARLAASGPSAESQFGRSAVIVRKATTIARADAAPSLPRASAAPVDALARPSQPAFGGQALAFGEQRPSQFGFAQRQGGLFGSLFGNM
jgi:hypothetical protein